MLSTYYIYYIVTTYYVVNGINIIDYLHNDNSHNGGHGGYMATLYSTGKRGLLCVYAMLCGVPCALYAIG